jgi:hypothetical protein
VERDSLARPFLERRVIGLNRLFEASRPPLPLAYPPKCETNVVMRTRPLERNPFVRPFLQRCAISLDRVPLSLQSWLKSAFPRLFWVSAHRGGTRSRVRSSTAARKALTASLSRAVPLAKRRERGTEIILRRAALTRTLRQRHRSLCDRDRHPKGEIEALVPAFRVKWPHRARTPSYTASGSPSC